MYRLVPVVLVALVFFVGVPVANASCTTGMMPVPPEIRALNPSITECATTADIERFRAAGEALAKLKRNICPGFTEGFDASIPPAELKETRVYFSYPGTTGHTSMSASALTCFANALQAMLDGGLNVCISAALRHPQAQHASCMDTANTQVCGRTTGGCSGSYGSCPHVAGIAMDFNDKATCRPGSGLPNNGCSISQTFANRMRTLAAPSGARPTLMTDLPHLECSGAGRTDIPGAGIVGPPGPLHRPPPGFGNPFMGNMGMFQPPMTCPPGSMMMYGQCLPQQAQNFGQMNSPYNYMPTPTPTPPSASSSPTNTSTNTNTNSNTVANNNNSGSSSFVDTGSSVAISDLIDSTSPGKKGSTSTSAIDLINAIANPTTTSETGSGVAIGKSVDLNDSLKDSATLSGALTSSSSLSASSTYTLNANATQTFVSQDLSKTAPQQQFGTYLSTFALLERVKQILVSILRFLQPFGGGGTPARLNQMLPYVD